MSSLVLELQGDALNSSVSILDLLRKALVVARKLAIKEFQEWIELELNGYTDHPIPEYRTTRGQLRAWNHFHGWQPIITYDQNLLEIYEMVSNCSIRQSISELVALVENAGNELQMQLPPWVETILVASVNTSVKIGISSASVARMVESVRDVILRWALKLEEDGIMGEGLTFSQEEKQIAARQNYRDLIQVINIGQSQMQNSLSQSSSNSETFNNDNDFRGATNINFANKVQDNARQITYDFSQNIGQNIDDITRLINSLREMAKEFPEAQRDEAMVHLDDLQEDITTPEKQKPQRIKTRLVALFGIGTFVAGIITGGAEFTNNVLELSEKLGVPIEFSQPQPLQQLPPLP